MGAHGAEGTRGTRPAKIRAGKGPVGRASALSRVALAAGLALLAACTAPQASGSAAAQPVAGLHRDRAQPEVSINGDRVSPAELSTLEERYGATIPEGDWWYDPRCGAFGAVGGPVAGLLGPGHTFGDLSSEASQGASRVYVNGRRLTHSEAAFLSPFTAGRPGRFWIDEGGNIGLEGESKALTNLMAWSRGLATRSEAAEVRDPLWMEVFASLHEQNLRLGSVAPRAAASERDPLRW